LRKGVSTMAKRKKAKAAPKKKAGKKRGRI
jgi:hypothetical protein